MSPEMWASLEPILHLEMVKHKKMTFQQIIFNDPIEEVSRGSYDDSHDNIVTSITLRCGWRYNHTNHTKKLQKSSAGQYSPSPNEVEAAEQFQN